MAYIAVQGCKLEIQSPGGSGNTDDGVVTNTATPASDVQADNKGCFFGQITCTVAGYTSSAISNWVPKSGQSTAPCVISGTGSHMTNNNMPAVLEGDSGTCVILGQVQSGNSTVPMTETITIKVTDAKQTYVDVT